jgi:hypothetical protein
MRPDGVTPGWPLGRNVSQIGPKLKRKQDALARRPRRMIKWLGDVINFKLNEPRQLQIKER